MAQCKKTAQEFIQDTFSPHVAVFCSHDAEVLCKKNNLSFVELIHPFCRLNTEAHIRDPSNIPHVIRNLRIKMQDMNSPPPQPTLAKKQLNEVVANSLPASGSSAQDASIPGMGNVITVGNYDLQISASTPWYEAYRENFLQLMYPTDHEFTRHLLACIFVVSSNHAEPMEQFGWLTGQQHQQQHHQAHKLPKWFCPNVLRYYVLLHDVSEGQEAKAESVFQKMKTTYDLNSCHLLQINSRRPTMNGTVVGDGGGPLPNPWSQFMNKKHEMSQDMEESTVNSLLPDEGSNQFPGTVSEGARPSIDPALEATEDGEVPPAGVIDHPLAGDLDSNMDNLPRDSQNNALISDVTMPSSSANSLPSSGGGGIHGSCLSLSDHDRLRIFVHDFVVKGLIPWAERTLRTLNDQVITRLKGLQRSLFGVTKKWFGGNKPASQSSYTEKTNVVYTSEAPEMQMRRLADLAFIFQLYEMAYQTYHAAKKDFNNDHAWLHYAAALEMASLSVFMQGLSSQRQYPHHYMESAVSTYLSNCKAPQYATRATLLNTEALKNKGMYAEAAMQLIKMTSEDSDLRSALLLEQAAHCFIKMKPPMARKYAFHMILAGHRFSKACQRRHALRSYAQALQVYKGKDWSLAEDHIHFTIGRQSFNLKQLENATSSFKHLLTSQSLQSPPQQAAFLREYLFVYKQQLSGETGSGTSSWTGELPQLPLPVIQGNDTKVICGPLQNFGVSQEEETLEGAAKWAKLEQLLLLRGLGHIPTNFIPTVSCHTNSTKNSANPCTVLGEPVYLEVSLVNPLKIPLVLSNVSLLWQFLPVDYSNHDNPDKHSQLITNETQDSAKLQQASDMIESGTIAEVQLEPSKVHKLQLRVTPHHTGELHITGVAYNLSASSNSPAIPQPSTENGQANSLPHSTSMESTSSGGMSPAGSGFLQGVMVRGKVKLEVQGPRLNTTKDEKAGKMYGPDRRLDLIVVPHMPQLMVDIQNMPKDMYCNEVKSVILTLKNTGHLPMHNLRVATTDPKLFTFGQNGHIPTETECHGVYRKLLGSPEEEEEEMQGFESTVDYVLPVRLTGGMLEPGHVCSIPMWVQAPDHPAANVIDLLFYYESTIGNPKLRYRVLRHTVSISTRASLRVKASAHRATPARCCHINPEPSVNDPLSSLLLALEVDNLNTLTDAPSPKFSVVQVSCASQEWKLSGFRSDKQKEMNIESSESLLLCLKADRVTAPSGDSDEKAIYSNVHFDEEKIASHLTPCREFHKFASTPLTPFHEVDPQPVMTASMLALAEGLGTKKLPPYAKLEAATQLDLNLVILWKVLSLSDPDQGLIIRGQHHISIDTLDIQVSNPHIAKSVTEQAPVQIVQLRGSNETPATLSPKVAAQLCTYTLHYTSKVNHDFACKRLCRVPITAELQNTCQEELKIYIKTLSASAHLEEDNDISSTVPSSTVNWSGHLTTQLTLPPNCSKSVRLTAAFFQAGIYDLSGVVVSAQPTSQPEGVNPVEMTVQRPAGPSLIEVGLGCSG